MNNKKGFSLIEVMIAMSIIVGAIIVLSSSWSGHYHKIKKIKDYDEIAYLLEKKMIEVESLFDGNLNSLSEEASGNFGDDYKNYRWELESQFLQLPSLSEIYKAQNEEINDNISGILSEFEDLMNRSIKEVKVTVFLKRGKREAQYNLVSYFISYDGKTGF